MQKIKLGDVADICLGKMLDKEKNKGEFEPYLANVNVHWGEFDLKNLSQMKFEKHEQNRYGLKFGDILMCEGGEPGRCAIWKDEIPNMKIQKALHRIRVYPQFNNFYVYYWLLLAGKKNLFSGSLIETTIKHLTAERLKLIEIDLPSREIQNKIAAVLSSLDEKISINKKINATLEDMAKTLYDYWFVQFDFPDDNGKPYKSSGGKMVFNAELGREIPVDCEVKSLGEIAKIIQGNSPEGKTLNETGNGMIFFQGKTDFGFRFPKVRIYTTAPYRLAEKFDTLLSVRAPVGAVNMANKKCCIGRGLAAIKSDYPSFIFYTIKKLRKILETISGIGTTFDSITKEDLIALKICIPPKEIIQKFENTVSKFDNEVFLRENENNTLENLRDFLLPLLMNGQVGFNGELPLLGYI